MGMFDSGQGRFNEWINRVRGWQAPTEEQMDLFGQGASYADRARAYMTKLLADTGAAGYLSPYYLNALKQNAVRPYLQNMLLAGAEYGQLPQGYGDFLKSWLTMPEGGARGWGTIGDIGQRVQQLGGQLRAGEGAYRAGQTTGPLAQLYEAYGQNPQLIGGMMGMMASGPFQRYLQQKIQDTLDLMEMSPMMGEAGRGMDWLEALLGLMPMFGR